MVLSYYIILVIIALGIALSIYKRKLTPVAATVGGICAWIIFVASGPAGIALLAAFFMMGVTATTHQWKNKQQRGLTDSFEGERTVGQVLANSGVAVILSILMLFSRLDEQLGVLMIAGGFASAAADTVSSELGNVYGRRFYNILSFKKTARGINGAISLEGTLAGIAASFLIAVVYLIAAEWKFVYLPVIVIAGTIGNISDSILGTTLENRKLLNNNAVNFINTVVGALAILLLHALFFR